MKKIISANFLTKWDVEILLVFALAVSLAAGSRSFCMGIFCAVGAHYAIFRRKEKSLKVPLALVALLLVALAVSIFLFKTGSSYGRILIYKISFSIFKDYWLNGVGFGKFGITYPHYQANFFRAGDYSTRELLLADNTSFLFNDYFQFVIETGLAGMLAMVLLIFLAFKMVRRLMKEVTPPFRLRICMAILIMICVAAAFDHVLYFWYFQIPAVLCAAFLAISIILRPRRSIQTKML